MTIQCSENLLLTDMVTWSDGVSLREVGGELEWLQQVLVSAAMHQSQPHHLALVGADGGQVLCPTRPDRIQMFVDGCQPW